MKSLPDSRIDTPGLRTIVTSVVAGVAAPRAVVRRERAALGRREVVARAQAAHGGGRSVRRERADSTSLGLF